MKALYRIAVEKREFLYLLGCPEDGYVPHETETAEKIEEIKMKNLTEAILLFSRQQNDGSLIGKENSDSLLKQIKRWGYQESWRRADQVMKRAIWSYEDVYMALGKSAELAQQERVRELIGEIREEVEKIK